MTIGARVPATVFLVDVLVEVALAVEWIVDLHLGRVGHGVTFLASRLSAALAAASLLRSSPSGSKRYE